VCNGASQNLHVQHRWQHNVIDIVAFTTDESIIFHPAAARSHATNFEFV
jgi:hypothetical protein